MAFKLGSRRNITLSGKNTLATSRNISLNTINFYPKTSEIQIGNRANSFNYVVVGGGGAGGTNAGSGGGAGGVNQGIVNSTYYTPVGLPPGTQLTISIGGGGAAAGTVSDTVNGSPGNGSQIVMVSPNPAAPGTASTSYLGLGGGAGGSASLRANVGSTGPIGWPTAFGGGSGGGTPSEATPLTPVPGYSIQGFAGGIGPFGTGQFRTTGGGGGASQVGGNGTPGGFASDCRGGKGGDGAPTWITGSNIILGGGGAGAVHNGAPGIPAPRAQGGLGGGGAAGVGSPNGAGQTAGFPGNVHTGGGGGGGGGGGAGTPNALGGVGGSGIVIISHPTAFSILPYTGSNVLVSTLAGNIVYQFYSSGTISFL